MTYALMGLAMVLVLPQTQHKDARGLVAWAVLFLGLGFATAALRTHSVAAPVLSFRYYGPVEGRIIGIDQSSSGRIRLTLDRVRLARTSFQKTPERVRVSVSSDQALPSIGATVATTAHLMPPQGPSEPGGFDFRRLAWFSELGAVGYTRKPVLVLQPAQSALAIQRFRARLSGMIQHRIAGETGGVAAAIIAGDRVGVSQETLRVLRGSNLAHLLAISGLHMGLLSGFVFSFIRVVLCLWPAVALRCNVKKIAACAALMAAVAYLAISGGNVATERAFIMVSVLLVAVLLDRRAFSLRAVAVAATLVLLRRPETLLSPGFQMSFAATTALVAVFGAIRDHQLGLGPAWLRPVLTVVVSSAVAGLATAPYGAAHFNTLAHFGLLANVLAVPIIGLVVVPSAVLALCLAPLGVEEVGFLFS
ncbi:ComEC/Rec2 family competence protein [Pseudophaeobacter leonis]|uniref:ComEC/Rec2 family competence protein n=1 Tax=Pseudophaeobacter leonis TaxID=1144477 RepID=UPI0030C6E69E